MLVTWIRDSYSFDDRGEMRRAVDTIASPRDYGGFASNGVYVFFDPESHAVLYIGLARDLSERFAQHNGLVVMRPEGCKVRQIRDWMRDHSTLGYAIAVQSSFSQAGVARQRGTPTAAFYDEESGIFWGYEDEGLEHIADVEAQLIAAYHRRHHRLPPWNKVHGRRTTHNAPTTNTYALLELASGRIDSLLLSRRTIRQLAVSRTALLREETMHVGRMGALEDTVGLGVDSGQVIESLYRRVQLPEYAETGLVEAWNEIWTVDYFHESPPPPATESTPGQVPAAAFIRSTPG